MIVSIIDDIKHFFEQVPYILEENAGNPFFWIILLLVLMAITFFAINNLGRK